MPINGRVDNSTCGWRPRVARRKAPRWPCPPADRQAGFTLVEVVLAIAILATLLAATGRLVVTGLQVGQNSRLKLLATDIASSALDCAVASLNVAAANFPTPCGEPSQLISALGYESLASVSRGGYPFTIEQEVEPGSGTCGIPTGGAPPELQVVDFVTWDPAPPANWWLSLPGSVASRYVEESTIVAVPAVALNPADGSIKVAVTDDVSSGQRNLQVTATDLSTGLVYKATTTDLGCALFLNMPPDPYSVSVSPSSGTYIDSNNDMSGGVPAPLAGANMNGNVGASQTLTLPSGKPLYYAPAAYVNASYTVPQVDGLSWQAPYVTSPGDLATSLPLSFWNANLVTNPYVAPAPSPSGDTVFPFQASSPSYYVVAGTCGTDSSPDGFSGGNPADGVAVPTSGTLAPGQVATANFTLVPVGVAVTSSGSDLSGAVVAARAASPTGGQDANCPSVAPTAMPVLQLGTTAAASPPLPGGGTLTAISSSADPSISGTAVTFSVTVTASSGVGTPTGSVLFCQGGTGPSCTGGTVIGTAPLGADGTATSPPVTLTSSGSPYGVYAVYSGDPNFTASSSTTLSQTVEPTGQGYATTTSVSASADPSVAGQPVTFTATVSSSGNGSPSTGTVTFYSDGTAIGTATPANGVATLAYVFASPGSHSITAQYTQGADQDFASSALSAPLSQNVGTSPDGTTTALSANANPSVAGQAVTFTATVSPASPATGTPSGTVQFLANGSGIAGCGAQPVASGTATCTTSSLGTGSDSISAVFTSSDPNWSGSSSPSVAQQVVGTDTLSGLPAGYWLLWASASGGSQLSTNTTTAVVLKVGSSGAWESKCTGGSYSGPYYSGGTCSAWAPLGPGAVVEVPVS